jgi:hypothetical protein
LLDQRCGDSLSFVADDDGRRSAKIVIANVYRSVLRGCDYGDLRGSQPLDEIDQPLDLRDSQMIHRTSRRSRNQAGDLGLPALGDKNGVDAEHFGAPQHRPEIVRILNGIEHEVQRRRDLSAQKHFAIVVR